MPNTDILYVQITRSQAYHLLNNAIHKLYYYSSPDHVEEYIESCKIFLFLYNQVFEGTSKEEIPVGFLEEKKNMIEYLKNITKEKYAEVWALEELLHQAL